VLTKIFFDQENSLKNKLYPYVYINQENFGRKSKKEVIQYFDKKNEALKKINFIIVFENQPVASLSGEKINLHYDGPGLAERAFLIGRSSNFLSKYHQKIATIFFHQSFKIEANLDFDNDEIKQVIAYLEQSYNKPAKNALFKFENNRVVSFRQEENGLEVLSAQFLKDFSAQVQEIPTKKEKKITIPVKTKILVPEITLAKANNYGIEELIGEGKSDYTHSIPERVHNIILAASKFDGILIPKNKILSFNETVGDISSLTGYKPAYIIKGGKTVLGDGGGVCQVSTTLFRAALNTGLPILERHPHAYRVGYYENDAKPGLDATVFSPTVDLKIKNDTPAYILIQTAVDQENNLLYFRFYGKKDGRRVEISSPLLWDVQPPPAAIYQDDPTLKKGVVKQVDFPAWGGKASFNYKIIYPDGKVVDDTFYSSYKPWQAVFLVGTAD
jgi:vancomycin resistance protein YoaR